MRRMIFIRANWTKNKDWFIQNYYLNENMFSLLSDVESVPNNDYNLLAPKMYGIGRLVQKMAPKKYVPYYSFLAYLLLSPYRRWIPKSLIPHSVNQGKNITDPSLALAGTELELIECQKSVWVGVHEDTVKYAAHLN